MSLPCRPEFHLMGSLDQHCSSPSFTWSIHTIWTPGINLWDHTQATVDPMAQPVLGVFSWLPWVLLPRESWCWVIPGHSTEWLYLFLYKRFWRSTSEISKGNVVVTIVTSVPWDMERVLGSWPCYELHSSVASFEEIWDAAVKRLFI